MGGFFGGRSDAEKKATDQQNTVFNYGLPEGQKEQDTGSSLLSSPAAFFEKLLRSGRTDTATMAAPAINSALAGKDAVLSREATRGTSRTGGTAERNREATVDVNSAIDNIINQSMMGGKAMGAEGLTDLGGLTLQNAIALLGLGSGAGSDVLQAGVQASDRRGAFGRMVMSQLLGGASAVAGKKF